MYEEKDFSNLQFNPLIKNNLLEYYPAIKEIIRVEISTKNDLDNILRYVIMISDPKSVLVVTERDLSYRKGIAADLSNLNTNETYRDEVFNYTNETVLELTVRYLMRFAKSKEFAAILALEYTYWESIRLLLKPINDNKVKDKEILDAVQKKGAIKSEIDSDLKRLESYYSSFYGEDKELINRAKERITPENIRKIKR